MRLNVLSVMASFTTMLAHAPIVATKEMRIMNNEWNWMRVKKPSKNSPKEQHHVNSKEPTGSVRRFLSKLTSPFFVPLRRLVVWGDRTFGTCEMKLTMEPRWGSSLDGFADMDEVGEQE